MRLDWAEDSEVQYLVRPKRENGRRPIRELAVIAIALVLLTVYLFGERSVVSRRNRRLPLRIAVTGTRGKSSVTRHLAAALREGGYSVLAKTSGSKPVFILPDGREELILRRGLPTIMEGRRVLKRAVELKAQALVAELMSIRPECLEVESRWIIQPKILIVTNARLDHREELGFTKAEIARSLCAAVPRGAEIFIPDSEFRPEYAAAAEKLKARITRVPDGNRSSWDEEGRNLALAVASALGVRREAALEGMTKAALDFGSLKVWEAELGPASSSWLLVSAFAANDPESSRLIVDDLRLRIDWTGRTRVALLNLRSDRGDRTRQWLEARENGFFSGFDRVYVVGAHTQALRLKKKAGPPPFLTPLTGRSPAGLLSRIVVDSNGPGVIIGLGNIGGLGAEFVEHWEAIGRPYAY